MDLEVLLTTLKVAGPAWTLVAAFIILLYRRQLVWGSDHNELRERLVKTEKERDEWRRQYMRLLREKARLPTDDHA